MEEERWFKYLGVELTADMRWKLVKVRMRKKARRNLYKAWATGIRGGFLSPAAAVNVYKGVVRACLEYGVEYFGDDEWLDAEQIQYEMGRKILCVGPNVPACAVRGELGLWRLRTRRHYLRLRFFGKLVAMPNDRLVKRVFAISRLYAYQHGFVNWSFATRSILQQYGLGADFHKTQLSDWHERLTKAMEEKESEEWMEEVKEKSKLSELRRVKSKPSMESYLFQKNAELRKLLTKMRCGGGDLRIERERGKNRVERSERLCRVCPMNEVEDERHFLLHCSAYPVLRAEFVSKFCQVTERKIEWEELTEDDKMDVILNGKKIVEDDEQRRKLSVLSGIFITKLFQCRKMESSIRSMIGA